MAEGPRRPSPPSGDGAPDSLGSSPLVPSSLTPEADALPVVFGRYRLEEVLGEGGMGRVYRATLMGPSGFRKSLALKVIRGLHGSSGEFFRQAFVREARIGGLLHHPNIVKVYDFGLHEGHPFLAMELVEGIELDALLSLRGIPPPTVALELAIRIATGLQHAHELEVDGEALAPIHRDLKSGNVLVTLRGEVKIMDFGLARTMQADDRVTEAGVLRGTPAYMSPEQAMGDRDLDPRSDLFALGVLLYELATGHHPWIRPTVLAQILALDQVEEIVSAPGFWDAPNAGIPGVDGILGRCLRADPADRFDRARDLALALRALLGELPPGPDLRGWVSGVGEEVGFPEVAAGEPNLGEGGPAASESGGPRAPSRARHNLPADRDTFIGRQEELAELERRVVEGQRLIALVGAGGTGKTRLSVCFGAHQVANFSGGVWFADLTEARARAGILSAVATALEVPLTQKDAEAQLADAIAGRRRVMIILDNFEQVIDHAADTVGHWLERAPEAVFLVTSRALLRVGGEAVLYLDPLTLPEAMQLFYDRAHALQPSFARNEANEPLVREIARRLDCMSLAIELAAARVRMMPPEQIRRRLSERFKLLRGERRDQSARQATLRGAIDWSWELLAPAERSTLAQLSAFHGGATLEAAEAVVDLSAFGEESWVMDTVGALVDHSLLRRVEPREGHVRFRMFESVRDYVVEKLGDGAASTGIRHARHFATFGEEEFLDSLDTHGGGERWQQLALEIENLVAAAEGARAAAEHELAAHCALAAGAVFRFRGPFAEGVALLERGGVENLGCDLQARLLSQIGTFLRRAGQVPAAGTQYERALAIHRAVGHRRGEGAVLGNLGVLHMSQGRMTEALTHYEPALAICREGGHRREEGFVLGNLGVLHMSQGRMTEALEHCEQALAIQREVGDRHSEGVVLSNLAILHQEHGHAAEALTHYVQTLAIHREVGDRRGEGMVLGNLGLLHMSQGRLLEASTHYEQALAIHREVGNRRVEGMTLGNLGLLHRKQGGSAEALTHYEQALAISREVGNRQSEAVVLGNLGSIFHDEGDLLAAEQHLHQAIEIGDAARPPAAGVHRGTLALIRAEAGDFVQARALLQRGDAQLRGVWPHELAKMLTKRVRVEQLAGDRAAADAALAEAETLAENLEAAPDSDLGEALATARELLAGPSAPS